MIFFRQNPRVKTAPANFLTALITLIMLTACAAEPDSQQLGSCKLSCGKPRVAGSEMKVVPNTNNPSVHQDCDADFSASQTELPLDRSVTVQYQVYYQVKSTSSATPSTGGEASAGFAAEYGVEKVPIGGIGFSPWAFGQFALEETTEEFKSEDENGNTIIVPQEFMGIATPSSEWCSDSCGVMKFEIWPVCRKGRVNNIRAGIKVQGVIPEAEWDIAISNDSGVVPAGG